MTPQDEFSRRREVEQGRKAQALRDTPYFKEVVERVRDRIYGDFASSRIEDDTARRNARLELGLVNAFLKELDRDIQTGKAASEQLRRDAEMAERQKRKEFT